MATKNTIPTRRRFLRSGPQSAPDPNSSNWLQFAPGTDGQFQVVTVRDVAMTPTDLCQARSACRLP